jgi:NAD(P)-dependent dehydrogenase (short-subunit alcohol dehydrogenase family)
MGSVTAGGPPTVIITGAAGNLGSAVAAAFQAAGASLVLVDLDGDRLAGLAGPHALVLAADAVLPATAIAAVALAEKGGGGVDVLVNCAGVDLPSATDAPGTSYADWNRVLDVNLGAAFRFSRASIPSMRRRGGGAIVNISSSTGLAPVPGNLAYNVSKAGVIALTRAMAADHAADGIRVNCVCPSLLPLPMADLARMLDAAAVERRAAAGRAVTPAGRLPDYADVAAAIIFLAGPDAGSITGANLVVDGGFTSAQRARHAD